MQTALIRLALPCLLLCGGAARAATLAEQYLSRFSTAEKQNDANLAELVRLSGVWEAVKDKSPETVQHRLIKQQALDGLEHAVYRKSAAFPAGDKKRDLLRLLDFVGAQHVQLISRVAANKEPIFLFDHPANAAAVQTFFEAIAARPVGFPLTISNTVPEDHSVKPALTPEVLSAFARLLSRPVGRQMITDILVTHQPHGAHAVALLTKVVPYYDGGAGAKASADNDHIASQGHAPGCGATVKVEVGVRETQYADKTAHGMKILSPSWLGLGHELIHVLHYELGTYRYNLAYPHGHALAAWTDQEEYATIQNGPGVTENALRVEHGLPQRGSHEGGFDISAD